MFEPEDEFGMFYSGFILPAHLVRCDLDVLMRFRMSSCDEVYSPKAFWYESDHQECQYGNTFFIADRGTRFGRGATLSMSKSEFSFITWGFSAAAISELGHMFGIYEPLHSCDGQILDLIFRFDRGFASALTRLRAAEIESIAADWCDRVLRYYHVEPELVRYRGYRGGWREYWRHDTEYATDDIDADRWAEVLQDLVDLCRRRCGQQSVFFAATR
jgi:hypothetical protein